MSDSKPHPSEFIEFSTVAPDFITTPSDQRQPSQAERSATREPSIDSPAYNDAPYQHMPRRGSVVDAAAQTEHRMTFTQALRLYPKAIGWSSVICLAIIMEGFDTALISSFYGQYSCLPSWPT